MSFGLVSQKSHRQKRHLLFETTSRVHWMGLKFKEPTRIGAHNYQQFVIVFPLNLLQMFYAKPCKCRTQLFLLFWGAHRWHMKCWQVIFGGLTRAAHEGGTLVPASSVHPSLVPQCAECATAVVSAAVPVACDAVAGEVGDAKRLQGGIGEGVEERFLDGGLEFLAFTEARYTPRLDRLWNWPVLIGNCLQATTWTGIMVANNTK